MFIALYEMKIKTGKEREFEAAWADWTEAIYRVRGSYGSRLHKTQLPGVYIAYAQWPSQEMYDLPAEGFTEKEKESSRRMRDTAEAIKTIHLMEVCKDLLKPVK